MVRSSADEQAAATAPSVSTAPPRLAGRRPALPNGRAVVGGLLVAVAVVGTFAAWSGVDDEPDGRVVVAARDLPVGETIDPGDIELVAVDLPGRLAARAFDDIAPVLGQRTVAPLTEGELVQRSAIVVPEDSAGGRQISFAIDVADALAGTLEEGETVDLLVTYGSGGDSSTEVVAAGATVAALPADDGDDVGGQTVVLLGLPEGTDVLALTNAIRQGSLTIVRSVGAPLGVGERFEPDAPTPTTAEP
jgi:Flp pilus assembly protein CpaB